MVAYLQITALDAKVMLTSVIEAVAAKVRNNISDIVTTLSLCEQETYVSAQSVVWETACIKRGFLSESTEPGEQGLWRLKTDGVNLYELWRHSEVLDINRAYTNNIHAMASTYGIEAAAKAIIKAS